MTDFIIWVVLASCCLCVAFGLVRLSTWHVAYLDRKAEAVLRAHQLIIGAEIETDLQRLEDAWHMQDQCNCEHCVRGRAEAQLENLIGEVRQ
ncbi:MAG TPA: hypothetical protein DDZ67_09105 [Xanthomonadaceae bacterium]|nr:hypothetical protein [Xanthomonadaceae bacterium]